MIHYGLVNCQFNPSTWIKLILHVRVAYGQPKVLLHPGQKNGWTKAT